MEQTLAKKAGITVSGECTLVANDAQVHLLRNTLLLGLYSRTIPRVLWWS